MSLTSDIDYNKIVLRNLCWRTLPSGETMILNLITGNSYITNTIGSYVWNFIARRDDIGKLVSSLESKFPENICFIQNDINNYIDKITYHCMAKSQEMNESTSSNSNIESHDDIKLSTLWAGKPSSAQIDITTKCNFNCKHCYLGSLREKDHDLDFQTVKDILNQLSDIGVYMLTISGGEVLLRPDICEIITYARKTGFSVTIASNASVLTDEHIECFVNSGISMVNISLYGASESTYHKATGVKSCIRVMDNCKKLVDNNIPIKLGAHATTLTVNDFPEMREFASTLGVEFETGFDLFPTIYGDFEPYKYLLSNIELKDIPKDVAGNNVIAKKTKRCCVMPVEIL